jgi:Putative beta-barrel porin-2, OmpL-like. bbp2
MRGRECTRAECSACNLDEAVIFRAVCTAIMGRLRVWVIAFALVFSARVRAQDGKPDPVRPPYTLGAYVEAFYQWNFNRPDNGITGYRGFDNRHDALTLANAAFDAQWDTRGVIGRLTLQVGHTPSTYYLAEPTRPGAAGTSASDAALWKYLQQAYLGYRVFAPLTLSAGLFLSPIGPEAMAVKDNWNWSRSNLFFGCPFYHTGARAEYALSDTLRATLAVYNGWNSVVDDNRHKSLAAQVVHTRERVTLSLLYFGGVERPRGAAEGQPWRHLFDAHGSVQVLRWLALMGHANAGFERGRFGPTRWAAGAVYARAELVPWLFLAARADLFREHAAHSAGGSAGPLFFPAAWVSSGTLTLEARPAAPVSLRLEARYDRAAGALYFGGRVPSDEGGYVVNRRAQTTLTLGATSWF